MSAAAIGLIAAIAAAIITALGALLVARVGRRTDRESQGVKSLGEALDGFRDLLDATRIDHETKLRDLQSQLNDGKARQSTLADRVQHLEKALAAARRYIDSLLIALRHANVVPPDPPDDYTH